MKWFIFRIFVTYFHWRGVGEHGYGIRDCWDYSDSFENFFDDVEWKTLIRDAEYAVYEDFTCWQE